MSTQEEVHTFSVRWGARSDEQLRRPGMRTAMALEIDGMLDLLRRELEAFADAEVARARDERS
jgi:hypothetical protein